jgi:hypothetical protein
MLKLPFRCPLLSLPEVAAPEQTAVSIIYLLSAEVQIPATFSNNSILVMLPPCPVKGGPGASMAAVTPTTDERSPWYGGSPWLMPG